MPTNEQIQAALDALRAALPDGYVIMGTLPNNSVKEWAEKL